MFRIHASAVPFIHIFFIAVLAALTACNECKRLTGTGRRTSGTITYREDDGLTGLTATDVTIEAVTPSTLTVRTALSESRWLSLELHDLHAGTPRTFVNDENARVCISDAHNIESCMPFAGTVDVKMLASECRSDERGMESCADKVDVTIRGKATSEKAVVEVDLTVTSDEHFENTSCPID
jgi:hypothetical protein